MAIIIIESIGFCATHSISEMLRFKKQNCVSHGTKNFKLQTKMGQSDVIFPEFLSQMERAHKDFENCISVHSNFNPEVIKQTTAGTETKFFGLVRKSQKNQILSCFYWAINNFLNGRQDMTNNLTSIHTNYARAINTAGLPSTMINCLMLYAIKHVVEYNFLLAQRAEGIFFMEDIISNPDLFITKIGLSHKASIPLEVKQGPSHKNKVLKYPFLSGIDEAFENLSPLLKLEMPEQTFRFRDFEILLDSKRI